MVCPALHGLTRNQLRYILDPHGLGERELADILDPWEDPTVQGPHLLPTEPDEDFPGETFRVLKDKEEKAYGEYRTRRLVLEAWERRPRSTELVPEREGLTMTELTDEQRQRAVEVMWEFVNAPPGSDGRTPPQADEALDAARVEIIEQQLRPLLTEYLEGRLPLPEFKSTVDGINKRHEHWGFKGIKGQMLFNMAANVATDLSELDAELRAAIVAPASEEMARSRLLTFASYIRRIGEQHVEAGGTKHGRPQIGSVTFFVSFFWQIQDRGTWPMYYTNAVNTMVDLNLWQPSDDLADNYIRFKHIYEELAAVFGEAAGRPFTLYDVEHVFWFKGQKPFREPKPVDQEQPTQGLAAIVEPEQEVPRLPESYVPPIVAVLPTMARNEPTLAEAAKASGTTLDRAFEKSVNAAFTILGYETKLLGQGQGRVPDGLALELDNSYAIIWDAKMRADGYSIGTDDRTIREYVTTQSRELKRRKLLRNIYYAIVSSGFREDYDDIVRMVKMETDVNEVCLIEAEALVAMVDAKLRDPLQLTLGPDGIQRLFSTSGVLTSDNVREILG